MPKAGFEEGVLRKSCALGIFIVLKPLNCGEGGWKSLLTTTSRLGAGILETQPPGLCY